MNFSPAAGAFADAGRSGYAPHLTLADVDGDGLVDLLLPAQINGVSVFAYYPGTGLGQFGTPRPIASGISNPVVVVDADNDGIPDVVGGGRIGFCRGLGGASFAPPVYSLATSGWVTDLAACDLNGDGNVDLVVQRGQSGSYSEGVTDVMLGDGAGHFALSQSFTGPAVGHYVSLGDIDGDGDVDIAVAGYVRARFSEIAIFRNDGPAGFVAAPPFHLLDLDLHDLDFGAPDSMALADLDGDGDLDAVVVMLDNVNDDRRSSIRIVTNTGGGAFVESAQYFTDRGAWNVAVHDLNGDGRPDIVVSSAPGFAAGGGVDVLRNLGDGVHFAGPSTAFETGFARYTVVADIDGHGGPDLVTSDISGSRVQISLNFTPQGGALVPDLDSDMTVGARDVGIQLACWPSQYPLGDINADGAVNSKDLAAVLGSYGMSVDAPVWYQLDRAPAGAAAGPSADEARVLSEQLMRNADTNGDGVVSSLELARALGAASGFAR